MEIDQPAAQSPLSAFYRTRLELIMRLYGANRSKGIRSAPAETAPSAGVRGDSLSLSRTGLARLRASDRGARSRGAEQGA